MGRQAQAQTPCRGFVRPPKVYRIANGIKQVIDYTRIALRFAAALNAPTPAGAAANLASELKSRYGLDNVNAILEGFNVMAQSLGRYWKKITKQIIHRSPEIAQEVAEVFMPRLPGYMRSESENQLQVIFFLPTAPGSHRGDRQGDRIISISDSFAIGVAPTGGRMFGFGVRDRRQQGYDQWFRIDWFDYGMRPPLNVHYHVGHEGDRHPGSHRVIWTP